MQPRGSKHYKPLAFDKDGAQEQADSFINVPISVMLCEPDRVFLFIILALDTGPEEEDFERHHSIPAGAFKQADAQMPMSHELRMNTA